MTMLKSAIWVMIVNLIFTSLVFAAPSEIVIIRHADKLHQPETGPALSAKGQIRAMKFAFYFLDTFGAPDYMFAADPTQSEGKNSSLRPIQTLMPLANILEERKLNVDVPILHPYDDTEYGELASLILEDSQYNNKLILICWSHGKIPDFAARLGVQQKIPDWHNDDYDSVYILKYNAAGKMVKFKILNEQYPVKFNGSWKDLLGSVSK